MTLVACKRQLTAKPLNYRQNDNCYRLNMNQITCGSTFDAPLVNLFKLDLVPQDT